MIRSTLLLLGVAALAGPALAEPVAPKKRSAREITFTKLFNQADLNGDEILDFEEFSKTAPATDRPVIAEIRFDLMASVISSPDSRIVIAPQQRGIFLEEFIEFRGGRSIKPTKEQIFEAADDDESGGLDLDEFAATRAYPASTEASIFRAFDRIDKDDNAVISTSEWGIKVRR